ncbi:MAG: sulfite exporter TauE/SafE family protein, partial [Gemmatimonadota bacterium]
MTPGVLLTLAAAGLLIGFLSGLVGIGGGVLIVPLLYFVYGHAGWGGVVIDPDLQAVVSHATSLFVIVPTAALGSLSYHRAGKVAWSAALPIAGVSIVAALVGTHVAAGIPAPVLKLGFALVLVGSGVRMLRDGPAAGSPHPTFAPLAVAAVSGTVVGLMSALLGVGGGIVAIPILIHLVGLPMDEVAATSLAIIMFTALAGATGYAVAGSGVAGLPAFSVGYVHLGAGLPLLA